jgi:transcriptional regulator with XRE-family HTH domain
MIMKRVALAREWSGLTQEQMARFLGISTTRYAHYETQTPMPPKFWLRFCHHAGVDWTKMLLPDPELQSDTGGDTDTPAKLG